MNSNSRRLTESSDESTNTKITQTTTLSSASDIGYIDEEPLVYSESYGVKVNDAFGKDNAYMEQSPMLANEATGASGCPRVDAKGNIKNMRLPMVPDKKDTGLTGGVYDKNAPPCRCMKSTPVVSNYLTALNSNHNEEHTIQMECESENQTDNEISEGYMRIQNIFDDQQAINENHSSEISQDVDHFKNSDMNEESIEAASEKTGQYAELNSSIIIASRPTYTYQYTDIEINANQHRLKNEDIELFLRRDDNIHKYQFGNRMLANIEESYRCALTEVKRKLEILKAHSITITVVTVIIIMWCCTSTVYCLSKRISHIGIAEMELTIERLLDSPDVRKDFRNQVLCVSCDDVSVDVMSFFRRQGELCCIKDLATLSHSMKTSYSEDAQKQKSRLFNLSKKLSEMEQKMRFQNFIIDVGEGDESSSETFVELDKVLEGTYKTIEKNERMINSLLERRRSSLHIVGRVNNQQLRWQRREGSIKIELEANTVTFPINGGTYFLYGNVWFSCQERISVGYQLDEVGIQGRSQSIASVQQDCLNGTQADIVVILQQIISVPPNQGKNVRFTLMDSTSHFVSSTKEHSFGLFEI
ncbi:hypothetical protein ACF0H5_023973 [Mactra antiquata]